MADNKKVSNNNEDRKVFYRQTWFVILIVILTFLVTFTSVFIYAGRNKRMNYNHFGPWQIANVGNQKENAQVIPPDIFDAPFDEGGTLYFYIDDSVEIEKSNIYMSFKFKFEIYIESFSIEVSKEPSQKFSTNLRLAFEVKDFIYVNKTQDTITEGETWDNKYYVEEMITMEEFFIEHLWKIPSSGDLSKGVEQVNYVLISELKRNYIVYEMINSGILGNVSYEEENYIGLLLMKDKILNDTVASDEDVHQLTIFDLEVISSGDNPKTEVIEESQKIIYDGMYFDFILGENILQFKPDEISLNDSSYII